MATLIVVTPQDIVEIVIVRGGGRYDGGPTLWDTRADGPVPTYNSADEQGLERSGNTLVVNASERTRRDAIKAAIAQTVTDNAAAKALRRQRFRRIDQEIDGATTVAALKTALKRVLKAMVKEFSGEDQQ